MHYVPKCAKYVELPCTMCPFRVKMNKKCPGLKFGDFRCWRIVLNNTLQNNDLFMFIKTVNFLYTALHYRDARHPRAIKHSAASVISWRERHFQVILFHFVKQMYCTQHSTVSTTVTRSIPLLPSTNENKYEHESHTSADCTVLCTVHLLYKMIQNYLKVSLMSAYDWSTHWLTTELDSRILKCFGWGTLPSAKFCAA